MTQSQAIKNINLSESLTSYMLTHSKKFEELPQDAHIVIIPKRDNKLAEENKKILPKIRSKNVYMAKQTDTGWRIQKFSKV